MEEKRYKIGEIANLFGLPLSTLRYWEKMNIFRADRNKENNYREYTRKSTFDLCEIVFWRNMGIPIEQLQNAFEMNISDIELAILKTKSDIAHEIESLNTRMQKLEYQEWKISQVNHLLSHEFIESIPDFPFMIPDKFDTNAYCKAIEDSYQCALLFLKNQLHTPQCGLVTSEDSKINEAIWSLELTSKRYFQCVLKTTAEGDYESNISALHNTLNQQGYSTGCTVARYLFAANEEKRYNYYNAWIEIL